MCRLRIVECFVRGREPLATSLPLQETMYELSRAPEWHCFGFGKQDTLRLELTGTILVMNGDTLLEVMRAKRDAHIILHEGQKAVILAGDIPEIKLKEVQKKLKKGRGCNQYPYMEVAILGN